jgi:hypothetical protein
MSGSPPDDEAHPRDPRDALAAYAPVYMADDPTADARAFLPKPSFPADSSGRNSDIYGESSPSASGFLLSKTEAASGAGAPVRPEQGRRKIGLVLLVIAILVVVVVAVVVPVYLLVIKPKSAVEATTAGASQTGNSPRPSSSPGAKSAIWGADGSTITTANGTTFTYKNKFGGICEFRFFRVLFSDRIDRLVKGITTLRTRTTTMLIRIHGLRRSTRPGTSTLIASLGMLFLSRWSRSLRRLLSVNLGGWFVLEPFISPVFYQRYPPSNDEWTLSTAMAADTANGGLSQIEQHYKTFIASIPFLLFFFFFPYVDGRRKTTLRRLLVRG